MAGQTYQVNYIVNVDATNARTAINLFKQSIASMDKAIAPIVELQRTVNGLVQTMTTLNRGSWMVHLDTSSATQKIGKLIRGLELAKKKVQELNASSINLTGVANSKGNKGKGSSSAQSTSSNKPAPAVTPASTAKPKPNKPVSTSPTPPTLLVSPILPAPASPKPSIKRWKPSKSVIQTAPYRFGGDYSNVGYKALGPTPLPNNGGMAVDMLKGMGIAYGIAGIGSLVSNIVDQSVSYDNTMKTVENILKSHDEQGDFSGRFASMTQTVRNVGMRTKFKVTEVADAAKFLAMAGLDVDAIQRAILPIADIALVGDTGLGETADLVTNIMTAYNIAPYQMRNAADIMTNTFTRSNTTLTEIAEAYKYAASLLSAGDMPFEEATAAIGVLGDAGIKGSQAGTTMRTIMANLVNPTKKQRAAWEDIGISLKDKSGRQKDVLQVFKELSEADLDVDAFYRIFHKTAASGAVALAAHSQKWEKIYLENFLAGGLARRLAEEKQNTLQGLWAQLTSVFTDQGVTAFSDIQGGLRSWMKTAIDWLNPAKNPTAQQKFKEVAATLMEFMQMLINVSKWFATFFDTFGWFIKLWVKFQLFIWPVVKAITALKSVFIGLMGLKKVGTFLVGLSGIFTKLGGSAVAASAAMAPFGAKKIFGAAPMTPFGFSAGTAMLPPLTNSGYIKAAKGLNLKRPHNITGYINPEPGQLSKAEADRQTQLLANQYRRDRTRFNKRVLGRQLWNGTKDLVRTGAGTGSMLMGMRQFTKDDANVWDYLSGASFSIAGIAAMTYNPVGWGIAIGSGVVGLAAELASQIARLDQLGAYIQSFADSHKLLDGVITNSSTKTEQYLEFVWRKNYDINDLIQRRIQLMKEEMGLESQKHTTPKDIGNETYKEWYDRFYSADSFMGSLEAADKARDQFNKFGKEFGLEIVSENMNWVLKDKKYAKSFKYNNPSWSTSDANDVVMYDVAAAMGLFLGPYRSKIIDESQHRLASMLYGSSTAEDVDRWINTFATTYGPSSWDNLLTPDKIDTDTEVAKHWSGEELNQLYLGRRLLWESLQQRIPMAQKAIKDFKQKQAAGKLTLLDIVSAIRWGDYDILGQTLADYNPKDIAGWYRNLGYYGNGDWHDPKGLETPEIVAQTTMGQMQKLLQSIDKLGLRDHNNTQEIQRQAVTLISLAQAFLGQGSEVVGSFHGETKTAPNGQVWQWDAVARQWNLLNEDNKLAKISQGLVDMSGHLAGLLTTVQKANSEWPTNWSVLLQTDNGYAYDTRSPFNWDANSRGDENWTTNSMIDNPLVNPSKKGGLNLSSPWSTGNTLWALPWKYIKTGVSLSPSAFGHLMNFNGKNLNLNQVTDTGDTGDSRYGSKTDDYKSHYSNKAIPKQININIQNLMNVESIDMSNPDNVAVIDNIKREVAYALVEAASDGTMMLNNLGS